MTVATETAGHPKRESAPHFTIFRARDAVDVDSAMMPYIGLTEQDQVHLAEALEKGAGEGYVLKQLFSEPITGMSLTYFWVKKNYLLPRHSHDADCTYYVISGEAHLGTNILRAGDGFFVPADHFYTYQAGPEGVEILEIRTKVDFHIRFSGNGEAFWKRFGDIAAENLGAWRNDPSPEAAANMQGGN